MTDDRPRPKYGELAPEGWAWTPPATTTEGEREIIASESALVPLPPAPAPTGPAACAAERRRPRVADLWVTIVLLAFGVLSTAIWLPAYLDFGAIMNQAFAQQGLGDYTAYETADRAGQILAATQVVLLLGAIAFSVLLLRAGRIAFYVPLIGAVLTVIVWTIAVLVAIFADPAALTELANT